MKQVNDKKFLSLDSKFQEKFRRLGIMEGDVTFEKCKKAMDHVDPIDFDDMVELTDYYAPGPVLQALRDGYTQRTMNTEGKRVQERPIELNVFREDCSSCKTMTYLTCMRVQLRANQSSDPKTKRHLAVAILTNYRLVEHFVARNAECDGKYMTRTIRKDLVKYIVDK